MAQAKGTTKISGEKGLSRSGGKKSEGECRKGREIRRNLWESLEEQKN